MYLLIGRIVKKMFIFRQGLWIIIFVISELAHPCRAWFGLKTYASAASCSNWNPLSPCTLAADPLARLSKALEEDLAGQTLASRAIQKAVAMNVQKYENKPSSTLSILEDTKNFVLGFPYSWERDIEQRANASKMRPLFMHFSGPTGPHDFHAPNLQICNADIRTYANVRSRKDSHR